MKTYTIYKGCHYSTFIPKIKCIKGNIVIEGSFEFDESCRYEIDEKVCVNKLFGFCFGFGVHKNSIRFGWKYEKLTNRIYIFSYIYNNGKLYKKQLMGCECNEAHNYTIIAKKYGTIDCYDVAFKIDNTLYHSSELIYSNKSMITILGPYFGGNIRAPHKMKIRKY